MSLRVSVAGEVKRLRRVSRSESEPEQGVLVGGAERETR